jgi:hypothetical protein
MLNDYYDDLDFEQKVFLVRLKEDIETEFDAEYQSRLQ